MKRNEGYIFFSAMIIIAIVFFLFGSVNVLAQKQLMDIKYHNDNQQAFYFAESGLEEFFSRLDEEKGIPADFVSGSGIDIRAEGSYVVTSANLGGDVYRVDSEGRYDKRTRSLSVNFLLQDSGGGEVFEPNVRNEESIIITENNGGIGFFDETYTYFDYDVVVPEPNIMDIDPFLNLLPTGGSLLELELNKKNKSYAVGDYNFKSITINKKDLTFTGATNIYIEGDLEINDNNSELIFADDTNLYIGGKLKLNKGVLEAAGDLNIYAAEGIEINDNNSYISVAGDAGFYLADKLQLNSGSLDMQGDFQLSATGVELNNSAGINVAGHLLWQIEEDIKFNNQQDVIFQDDAIIYVGDDLEINNNIDIITGGDLELYIGDDMNNNNNNGYDFGGATDIYIGGDMKNNNKTDIETSDLTRVFIEGDMFNNNQGSFNVEGYADQMMFVFDTTTSHDLTFYGSTYLMGGVYAPTGNVIMASAAVVDGGIIAAEIVTWGSSTVIYNELIENLTLTVETAGGTFSYDIVTWQDMS